MKSNNLSRLKKSKSQRLSTNIVIHTWHVYHAHVRKLLSLFMSCILLTVTTLPTASLAVMCAVPKYPSMNLEDMANKQVMQQQKHHAHSTMNVMHNTDTLTHGDWQTCRIECGCGCHRHLDSLPHLLSPHMMSNMIVLSDDVMTLLIEYDTQTSDIEALSVQLPPPRLT